MFFLPVGDKPNVGADTCVVEKLVRHGHDGEIRPHRRRRLPVKKVYRVGAVCAVQEHLKNGVGLRGFASKYIGIRSYALWSVEDPLPALTFIRDKAVKGIGKIRRKVLGIRASN